MSTRREIQSDLEIRATATALVDHHVHGALGAAVNRPRFEEMLNEGSHDPVPAWMTQFDSQLGFAIRRWCAPVLDLQAHASADDYWERRCELGEAEVNRRFLTSAGVVDWIIDTGYQGPTISETEMREISGARVHKVVRLESVAASLAREGVEAGNYAEAFRARLARETAGAVGVKTVLAYRCGFDLQWRRPSPDEVTKSAGMWLSNPSTAGRLADPILLLSGLYAAVDLGLPIQFHVGFGDHDLDLHRVDPCLLLDFLRQPEVSRVPVLLLHCYPFHRNAGYLAQSFGNVYFDVGLALNYAGSRSAAIVAEALEMAPFAKQLFSSDGWGPAELHYLGARLWRRAMVAVLGAWVEADEWSFDDAARVLEMIGQGNARRVYGLDPIG
jgi:predicted TIM-barrel fold metal-dependent hydrolase